MLEVLISLVISLIMIIGFLVVFTKNKKSNVSYDEMQQLVRLKAYKNSYLFLIIYFMLTAFYENFIGTSLFINSLVNMYVGILFSIGLFAIICAKNDAFIGISESLKRKVKVLFIIGLINFIVGLICIFNNTLMLNYQLTINIVYLIIGVIFITLSFFLMKRKIKKDSDKEE